jgi:hypothetical protein
MNIEKKLSNDELRSKTASCQGIEANGKGQQMNK